LLVIQIRPWASSSVEDGRVALTGLDVALDLHGVNSLARATVMSVSTPLDGGPLPREIRSRHMTREVTVFPLISVEFRGPRPRLPGNPRLPSHTPNHARLANRSTAVGSAIQADGASTRHHCRGTPEEGQDEGVLISNRCPKRGVKEDRTIRHSKRAYCFGSAGIMALVTFFLRFFSVVSYRR
jgi:hypothetical protein